MTIINGIEIDDINYQKNEIKIAIENNEPLEDFLNVIIVISNPCLYAKRYILWKEFVKRLEEEESNVRLFMVEMIYPGQKFIVTNKKNPRHLQLKTEIPLWHKENMINLAVKYLLPCDYKAFAWIDADIEFENPSWAMDTLKILNGSKDIIQLFSHCIDMSREENTLNIFHGFGYSFCKKKMYILGGKDYWHPGYAWAITRKAYEKMDGLLDKAILGSGDNIMALALIGKCETICNTDYHDDYNTYMMKAEDKRKHLRIGYIPGVIRHYFHGSKENRKYTERWKILMKYRFSPSEHIIYDASGIMIPSSTFPSELQSDILTYFSERKEDDGFIL